MQELQKDIQRINSLRLGKIGCTDVPNRWELCKQGDICEFINGYAYSLSEIRESGYPIIRIQNLTGGDTFVHSNLDLPEKQFAEKGDLLFAWSATFGPYIWEGPKASYHYHIWKLIPKNSVYKIFLYYHLDRVSKRIKLMGQSGLGMIHMTKEGMENYPFLKPPIKEQQEIGSILSKVDELIQKIDQIIERTQRLKKGLMQRLLTKGIGHTKFKEIHLQFWFQKYSIPQEWKTVTLREIVKLQTGYPFKSENFSESGIRLLKGSNVLVQKIDWQDVDYYPESEVTNVVDYLLREGDIVIAMDRPFISDGFKIARTSKKDLPCLLVQRIGRFLRSSNIDYEYLYYFLHSEFYLKNLLILQKGMDLPHISNSEILSPLIPLPDLIEQKQITSILSSIDHEISEEKQHRSFLIDMKNGLMQKLLTGKIRVKV
jgi:type I restriction enzyme S subunit